MSIVAQRGDSASIKLVNGLAKETITHWHGMIVDERNDGGPRYAVPPGSTYDYAFTINPARLPELVPPAPLLLAESHC